MWGIFRSTIEQLQQICFPVKKIGGCTGKMKLLIYNSLPNYGARLFNCLPKEIRNITKTSVDSIKHSLDKFLQTVANEPKVTDYTQFRQAPSNSLLEQISCMKIQESHQRVSTRSGPSPASI